ncbi:MAG: hypothetical protein K2X31_11000 [Sphingopyxis sp.]|nr:hypothetical protein [Sphingopyxis sp.]
MILTSAGIFVLAIYATSVISYISGAGVYSRFLITPVTEELARLSIFLMLGANKYIAGTISVVVATIEINNPFRGLVSSNFDRPQVLEIDPEIYLTMQFPLQFSFDVIGHFFLGWLMIRFWDNKFIRIFLPIVVHMSVNFLGS